MCWCQCNMLFVYLWSDCLGSKSGHGCLWEMAAYKRFQICSDLTGELLVHVCWKTGRWRGVVIYKSWSTNCRFNCILILYLLAIRNVLVPCGILANWSLMGGGRNKRFDCIYFLEVWWAKNNYCKGYKQTLVELNSAYYHSQAKCQLVQPSYINWIKLFLFFLEPHMYKCINKLQYSRFLETFVSLGLA